MELVLSLNKVPTRLLTWGNPLTIKKSNVIVCITGSPGIIDFYNDFATSLHKTTGLPVCLVGHAGQDKIEGYEYNEDQENLYDLKGQVNHKLDLVNNHIDKSNTLHLVGHSIGAWMAMEMIQNDPNLENRIASYSLLFPLLQKMVKTKNGRQFQKNNNSLTMFTFKCILALPKIIQEPLTKVCLMRRNIPYRFIESILRVLEPKNAVQMFMLGYDEITTVTDLNTKILDKIKSDTKVIYSSNDDWAPLEFMEDLKQFQPELQMDLIESCHAFIFDKKCEEVMNKVSGFVKSKILD